MRVIVKVLSWAALLAAVSVIGPSPVDAAVAIPQITDINGTPGGAMFGGPVNIFASGAGAPFQVDDTAIDDANDIVVYTMDGFGNNDGAGLSISISNGDNDTGVENPVPPDPVFAAIGNAGGRLENGDALRFSMWMRQDPADPVTKFPQIEPVLKFELWKTALSGDADFEPPGSPRFGERIWDTDQNAGHATFNGHNQSQASWVDMNNDGATSFGKPVAESLVPGEWRLVEAFLVVDDDPLDNGIGWTIGGVPFNVGDVQEVRAVMFLGDFNGTDLVDAGSIWVDNLLLEVFANEAQMLATPNPNSAPAAGLTGDYNGNGTVDAADYVLWRNDPAAFGGSPAGYNTWRANFGDSLAPGSALSTAVPEAGSLSLAILALVAMIQFSRVRHAPA
ncbi:MAG TPA: hypothetical protein VHK01_10080 [Lacipirellulaceae bacterium]|nr:hypothetical protein [Lacipirellulaceae bacterium]